MRAAFRLGAAALLAVPLSACGGGSQPADEAVPQLAEQLQQIDHALASEQYHQARKELHALTSVVASASDSGDLENGQADGILAAAADLRAALPTLTPSPEPSVDTQTESPSGGDEGSEEEPGKPEKPEKPVKDHPGPGPKDPKGPEGPEGPKGEAKGHDK